MPILPWKTTRASRISQIVADLQSPQCGGSLVVETGFPTSIVDLFVKHRERLRNHSARRKSKKKGSKNVFHESIAQLSCSIHQSHPPEINSTCSLGGNIEIEDLKVSDDARVVSDGCDLVRNRTETCGVVGGGAAGGNGVGLVVLKMFVVSILALSTKKFVVEITLFAFLLLLLEFVGKRAVRLNACARGEAALRSLIHKISKRIWIGKDDLVVQVSRNYERQSVPKVSVDDFLNESIDSPESSSSIEEIKLLEPDIDACEMPKGIEDEQHHLGFLGDEIENKDGANRHGTRGRRNRRMFERIVRRKSGSQAIKKNNNREDLELRSDRFDEAPIEEQVNEEDDENLDQEQDRQTRSILSEEEEEDSVSESCETQWIQRERSMSCPILVLIVLSGLFGGRFLAVVLTTACCFMIKLSKMQGGLRIRH